MSNPEIPLSVDTLKPFEQGTVKEGSLALAGMRRLEPLVLETEGEAAGRLASSSVFSLPSVLNTSAVSRMAASMVMMLIIGRLWRWPTA